MMLTTMLAIANTNIPEAQQAIPDYVWAFLGTIFMGGSGFLIYKLTARQTDKAASATDRANARRDAVEGYDKLTVQLSKRLTELDSEVRSCREENRALHDQVAEVARGFREGIAFIERLLDYIVEHANGQTITDLPPIPAEVLKHLSPTVVESWRIQPPTKD